MGKTKTLEIYGSSNVGLYGYTNDHFCLIGKGLTEEIIKTFTKALDVPVYEITIGGSQQIGVYIKGNNKKTLVSSLILPKEEEILKELNIDYAIIDTKNTALGNNLIVGENHFFYTPEMESSAIKQIEKALGFSGTELFLEDWDVIGSVIAINSLGGLVQKDVPEEVVEEMRHKLNLPLEKGTINFGSSIIGGGVVVNKNGMVIGRVSAGIEVTNADMAFGFLEK